MENPIWIRIIGLERGCKGISQDEISDLGDPKLQIYNRFNIELLQREKRCVVFFLNLHKFGLKKLFEVIQRTH